MNEIFDRVLQAARKLGASDVHLKVGLPPVFRIRGSLRTLKDVPPMTSDVINTFAVNIMTEKTHTKFVDTCDVDLAYATPDGLRYRVNVMIQRSMKGLVHLSVCDVGVDVWICVVWFVPVRHPDLVRVHPLKHNNFTIVTRYIIQS